MSTGRPESAPRLIADIGGTNARFALLEGQSHRDEIVLACADYPDFVSAAEHYLTQVGAAQKGKRPVEAAVAIAGPITGDIIRMTNHVWQFSAARVRQQLGFSRLIFLNDFTALAMAVRHLPESELEPIGGGRPVPNAAIGLIGPGTGLGVSGLIPSGSHWIALQGEGGHATLSVMNEREMAVLRQLHQRFSHVSAERVISGPGLVNLYEAISVIERKVPDALTPKEITRRASEGSCARCLEAVNMFCALFGTMAGNLVLTLGAVGGLYIGGGVVPHLGRLFKSSPFRDRFEDKGRYAEYLSAVPVYLIRSPLPAFVGLARSFIDPGPRLEAE
ncbi:glucokinase [Povalibacter uvarum]|uniref:Glucokinase n=1 Tax=Povalibacter uvarum TaxID=732238 RepID=A0A841HSV4_9GAMM|nr:glucokinase [Povalibacter uvarum]MBB6095082.1 glucokinase [Povalibacter uvarum]